MDAAIEPLFDGTPLRELPVALDGQSFSLLVVKDAYELAGAEHEFPQGDIYWAELWPAALALSEAILKREIALPFGPEAILEIGCGTGLASLSAARRFHLDGKSATAPVILAADREERALILAAENVKRNALAPFVRTLQMDWSKPSPGKFRCILAADCLYHADACWQLAAFIRQALDPDPGSFAIVADPQRWSARNFSLHAQQAGLSVKQFQRAVPLVASHGPVGQPATSDAPKVEADFYELRLL